MTRKRRLRLAHPYSLARCRCAVPVAPRRTAEKEALAREKSLKAELSALEKKCVMIQRRDNQYRHELRKSEMNLEKIQDKLHKLVLERSGTAGAKAAVAQGGWELSSTIKPGATRGRGAAGAASSMLGDSHALPTSSADIELLQSTLSTYSERMNELVGENLALKAAMRSLEGEVQRVLTEQDEAAGEEGEQSALEREMAAADADAAAASSPAAPALDADGNPVSPSAGPASNSTGRCLSPTTLSLLSDFHPSQIELPWDLVGRSVEKVLHGKLALLRAGVAAARARQSRALDAQWEESVLDALKAKVGEQAAIIQGQDQLLQQVLFAQQSDALVAEEERECRRLSMRAEADDLARRRAASQADTPALLLSASKPRSAAAAAAHHSHQSWAASPASLRILGGHTANNLPVFATPAFVRKQPQTHLQSDAPLSVSTESGASAAAAASSDFISPSSAHSIPLNSKSKWHAGGVLTTPTFTPSRRSGVRPRAGTLDEESDLSRIHASGLEDDEVDDDDAAIDLDDDDEAALSPVPIDITAGLDSMPPTPSAPLTSTHAHA